MAAGAGWAGRSKFFLRFNGAPRGWTFVSGGGGGGLTEITSFTAGTRVVGNAGGGGTRSAVDAPNAAVGCVDGAIEPGAGFGKGFSGCGSSRSTTLSPDEEEAPECMRS